MTIKPIILEQQNTLYNVWTHQRGGAIHSRWTSKERAQKVVELITPKYGETYIEEIKINPDFDTKLVSKIRMDLKGNILNDERVWMTVMGEDRVNTPKIETEEIHIDDTFSPVRVRYMNEEWMFRYIYAGSLFIRPIVMQAIDLDREITLAKLESFRQELLEVLPSIVNDIPCRNCGSKEVKDWDSQNTMGNFVGGRFIWFCSDECHAEFAENNQTFRNMTSSGNYEYGTSSSSEESEEESSSEESASTSDEEYEDLPESLRWDDSDDY